MVCGIKGLMLCLVHLLGPPLLCQTKEHCQRLLQLPETQHPKLSNAVHQFPVMGSVFLSTFVAGPEFSPMGCVRQVHLQGPNEVLGHKFGAPSDNCFMDQFWITTMKAVVPLHLLAKKALR